MYAHITVSLEKKRDCHEKELFTGFVDISGTRFDYVFRYTDDICDPARLRFSHSGKRNIQFALSKNGRALTLNEDEFLFFFELITGLNLGPIYSDGYYYSRLQFFEPEDSKILRRAIRRKRKVRKHY